MKTLNSSYRSLFVIFTSFSLGWIVILIILSNTIKFALQFEVLIILFYTILKTRLKLINNYKKMIFLILYKIEKPIFSPNNSKLLQSLQISFHIANQMKNKIIKKKTPCFVIVFYKSNPKRFPE